MLTDTKKSPYAKAWPLPAGSVKWLAGFWQDAARLNAAATVPHLQSMFEAAEISHVLENFRICAGERDGAFAGTVFGDGDFYKWMEAAMYTACANQDEALFKQLDDYIDLIGRAQLADGYISTKQIIGERQNSGIARLGDINDFEVYNFGHLFTSACLYYRLTSKDNFLEIAKKAAGYLNQMYLDSAKTGEVQTAVCPSHYMGLVELYRTTGDHTYLELARLAVSLRDSVQDGTDDNQDRIPLKQHEKIVGHAVRANYLYAGTADLYLETGDQEYLEMLHKVWANLIHKKLYLTGGCGALYNGVSPYGNFFTDQKIHQAYGYEYQLPSITAYNETCASVGSVLWAYRMFLAEPKAEYFDLIERTMLNTNLAAVSLDGKKYFYENMLRRTKELDYELVWPLTRSEYILSYCCPPNLSRTIAQSAEYAYLVSGHTLWLGMYGSSEARISFDDGQAFTIRQQTGYPYDGKICLELLDVSRPAPITLMLRIPGWASRGYVETAGQKHQLTAAHAGSYYELTISRPENAKIVLNLEMPVRFTIGHPFIEETTNQAAVERGPLVYCLESHDTESGSLEGLYLDPEETFEPREFVLLGRSLTVLAGTVRRAEAPEYNPDALYQTLPVPDFKPEQVRLIPYFAWDNREFGEMKIWLPLLYRRQPERGRR